MKKSKKEKKDYSNVSIKYVELTPTTIGEINDNENSILGVIFIFIFLIVIIFLLPYVVNFISGSSKTVTPNMPSSSEEVEPPSVDPLDSTKDEVEFLDVTSPISKTISGFRYELSTNISANSINVKVTNVSGSAFNLVNNPTYIELYTAEKTLLDRILITKQEVVSNATISFDFKYKDNTNSNQVPVYLTLSSKSINDYPAINVKTLDINNMPFLTCTKDNETLVYTFLANEKGYYLTKISDTLVFTNADESTINIYESLANSYNSIDGVKADILPKTNGFSFTSEINLSNVIISEKKRILNNLAYYEKDTEAKTIYFELNASGFRCN